MKKIILIIIPVLCIMLSSCTGTKTIYFNDSDRVSSGIKGDTIKTEYDFVIMSKGKFRELTTISLENGNYECKKVD